MMLSGDLISRLEPSDNASPSSLAPHLVSTHMTDSSIRQCRNNSDVNNENDTANEADVRFTSDDMIPSPYPSTILKSPSSSISSKSDRLYEQKRTRHDWSRRESRIGRLAGGPDDMTSPRVASNASLSSVRHSQQSTFVPPTLYRLNTRSGSLDYNKSGRPSIISKSQSNIQSQSFISTNSSLYIQSCIDVFHERVSELSKSKSTESDIDEDEQLRRVTSTLSTSSRRKGELLVPPALQSASVSSAMSLLSLPAPTIRKNCRREPKPIFISYCRRNKQVVNDLYIGISQGCGTDCWIDWIDIAKGEDWWRSIQRGIACANVFIFMLSYDSLTSKVCLDELCYALKLNKRIIPVALDSLRHPVTGERFHDIHPALRALPWTFYVPNDGFDIADVVLEVEERVSDNYELLTQHTVYLLKAMDWRKCCRQTQRKFEVKKSKSNVSDFASLPSHSSDPSISPRQSLRVWDISKTLRSNDDRNDDDSDNDIDDDGNDADLSWLHYKKYNSHFLLSSEEVEKAFEFADTCMISNESRPTALQSLYFNESLKAANIQRATTLIAGAFIIVMFVILATLAALYIVSANEYLSQSKILTVDHSTCSQIDNAQVLLTRTVIADQVRLASNIATYLAISAYNTLRALRSFMVNDFLVARAETLIFTYLREYPIHVNSTLSSRGRGGVAIDASRRVVLSFNIKSRALYFVSLGNPLNYFIQYNGDFCAYYWDTSLSTTYASTITTAYGDTFTNICSVGNGLGTVTYPNVQYRSQSSLFVHKLFMTQQLAAMNQYGLIVSFFTKRPSVVGILPLLQQGQFILKSARSSAVTITLPSPMTGITYFNNNATVVYSGDGTLVVANNLGSTLFSLITHQSFASNDYLWWLYTWDVVNVVVDVKQNHRLSLPSSIVPSPIVLAMSATCVSGELVAINQNGSFMAISGRSNCIMLYSSDIQRVNTLSSAKMSGWTLLGCFCIQRNEGLSGIIYHMVITPDDATLVLATDSFTLLLFNISDMIKVATKTKCTLTSPLTPLLPFIILHDFDHNQGESTFNYVSVSADSVWIAATASDFYIRIWHINYLNDVRLRTSLETASKATPVAKNENINLLNSLEKFRMASLLYPSAPPTMMAVPVFLHLSGDAHVIQNTNMSEKTYSEYRKLDYCEGFISVAFNPNFIMPRNMTEPYPYELSIACDTGVVRFVFPYWRNIYDLNVFNINETAVKKYIYIPTAGYYTSYSSYSSLVTSPVYHLLSVVQQHCIAQSLVFIASVAEDTMIYASYVLGSDAVNKEKSETIGCY